MGCAHLSVLDVNWKLDLQEPHRFMPLDFAVDSNNVESLLDAGVLNRGVGRIKRDEALDVTSLADLDINLQSGAMRTLLHDGDLAGFKRLSRIEMVDLDLDSQNGIRTLHHSVEAALFGKLTSQACQYSGLSSMMTN